MPCFPSLADLPGVPDAVVVAIPAAGVPAVIEEAGALGCGGAVVFAAGFREERAGRRSRRHARGTSCAPRRSRHALPVCGPNCDGLIALHARAALWGDALVPQEPGHVALVSQSGNLVVNALATRRGLRLHTAISSGNEAVLTHAGLPRAPGRRAGGALGRAADRGRRRRRAPVRGARGAARTRASRVAVLKVGASAVGAAAAAAHTGAVAGDHRVFRALVRGGRRGVGGRRRTSCSSSPRRSPSAAPGRAAAASRSSPARAATRASAPTRPSASASTLPAFAPAHRGRAARARPGRPPRSRTRSTTRR